MQAFFPFVFPSSGFSLSSPTTSAAEHSIGPAIDFVGDAQVANLLGEAPGGLSIRPQHPARHVQSGQAGFVFQILALGEFEEPIDGLLAG